MDVEVIPIEVTACCILHNMCKVHGDNFQDSWLVDSLGENTSNDISSHLNDSTSNTSQEAKAIRETLVRHFSQ